MTFEIILELNAFVLHGNIQKEVNDYMLEMQGVRIIRSQDRKLD